VPVVALVLKTKLSFEMALLEVNVTVPPPGGW
jgi:hypothetical protein